MVLPEAYERPCLRAGRDYHETCVFFRYWRDMRDAEGVAGGAQEAWSWGLHFNGRAMLPFIEPCRHCHCEIASMPTAPELV
jgi:hypothetical protein